MIRIIVNGASGAMGRIMSRTIENDPELELVAGVDVSGGEGIYTSLSDFTGEADMIIDFSHHLGTVPLLTYAKERKLPIVLCTTGQTEEEMQLIRDASAEIPIFKSANMSVGVALLAKLVEEVAAKFSGCNIEILELHHNRKLDAPSGTAIMLADAAKKALPDSEYVLGRSGHHKREPQEIGISAIRMGNIVGTHEVMFGTNTQTITLKHEAHDRALFADGAADAAKFLFGKPAGYYDMDDLLA